jgi:hypothetical protein
MSWDDYRYLVLRTRPVTPVVAELWLSLRPPP